ncbi:MAG TPA: YncE family protein [Micropepsaceae bacterium]|nr:YncE family protein [Micropepsaceae bacterium]
MKAIPVALLVTVAASAVAYAAAPNYHVVDRIKVGDGGFDYAVFDTAGNRALIARTNYTTAIDGKTGKVSQLSSASAGHMAIPIPGTDLLVLPQGKGSVLIVDGKADKEVATLPGGKAPDGAVYDPYTKDVWVMNHNGGDATVVDAKAGKVVATVDVGGGVLEFPASDGAGKIFVNVEDKSEIGVIDAKAMKTIDHWKMPGCTNPTGLAYSAKMKLLVSSCGANGVAKIIDATNGKEVASLAIATGADAVMVDDKRGVALIPTRSGQMEVISLTDRNHIEVVQHVPTQEGSRTGILDPNSGKVYSMAAKFGPPATQGGRPQALPGTFEVLVIAP